MLLQVGAGFDVNTVAPLQLSFDGGGLGCVTQISNLSFAESDEPIFETRI
jgi:hypothetical protein